MSRTGPRGHSPATNPAIFTRSPGVGWVRLAVDVPIALLILFCLRSLAVGQQADSALSEEEVTKRQAVWRELLDRQPAEYKIYLDTEKKTALSLRKVPVLRWANYTRSGGRKVRDAATYIWTAQGRPEVVACVFPMSEDGTTIRLDMGSLARRGLIAERDGRRVWYPKEPGVKLQPVPGSPAPAESAAARLRQMKELAIEFRSTLIGLRGDGSDREELRMLPQPVYRYESESPELLDGAMFFFVQGTDPESLLLLEAVREGSGYQWQYALARRSSGALMARYQEQTVWRIPTQHTPRNPAETRIEFDHRVPALW